VIEEEIFRRFHLPQMYLGGLPLAFLSPNQLRWIIGPLQELWSEWKFDAESYDSMTQLLGLYGCLVRERRSADRKTKELKTRPTGLFDPPTVEDDEIVLNARPWTGSDDCPKCGRKLQQPRVIRADEKRIVFAVLCGNCDAELSYVADREDLETLSKTKNVNF
jgi:hypothetical protein